jgi:hypothetical protein
MTMAMNIRSALKAARSKWGENAYVVDRGAKSASNPVLRGQALEELKALRESLKDATEEQRREARERRQELMGAATQYRYRVGYIGGGWLFFSVQGQGDSWEEALSRAGVKVKQ